MDVNILHNKIRNLENKIYLYENNHFFKNKIDETLTICISCKSKMDNNGNKVKKYFVEKGENKVKKNSKYTTLFSILQILFISI